MKFQSSLLLTSAVLCAVPSVLADWENLTLSDYRLTQSGESEFDFGLFFSLPKRGVNAILQDTNHENPTSSPKIDNLVSAYTWEDVDGYDDVHTKKWFPQGITTSADALGKGTWGDNKVHIVTWHSDSGEYDGSRGARISFVNMNEGADREYRNVLLVEPNGSEDFNAIEGLHAGGIFWYGNLLYVVETGLGLRVFDMDHIYEVDVGDGIGLTWKLNYEAYGYKYVMPQVRTYRWQSRDDVEDLHFSFVALDRTTVPDSIIVGEYQKEAEEGTPIRLIHFDIDYTNRLLHTEDGVATASRAVSHRNSKVQGAITINDKYFLTQSGGHLTTFSWLDGEKTHEDVFPAIPEDLSYEEGYGLWTVTENRGQRYVAAIDHTKF